MPRMSRRTVLVHDRPGRMKLALRRGRRLFVPTIALASGVGLVFGAWTLVHSWMPGGAAHGTIASPSERLGRLSAALGWRVQQVVVEGRVHAPEPLLRAALGVSPGDPALGISLPAARARIETISWIERASVSRRLPGIIRVAVAERQPYAVWQSQGRLRLIDHSGRVLAEDNLAEFQSLPLVVGAGAAEHAAELLDALAKSPPLQARTLAAVRVGERRWNLHMQNGIDVLLPEGHEAAALDRLAAFQDSHDLLGRPLAVIDLRLPDRVILRPQPARPLPAEGTGPEPGPEGATQPGGSTDASGLPRIGSGAGSRHAI